MQSEYLTALNRNTTSGNTTSLHDLNLVVSEIQIVLQVAANISSEIRSISVNRYMCSTWYDIL